MNIKYFGHSTFIIEFGKRLLFDPFITGNVGGRKEFRVHFGGFILLSHGHGDHVKADAEAIAKTIMQLSFLPTKLLNGFNKGISGHPMNIGGGGSLILRGQNG